MLDQTTDTAKVNNVIPTLTPLTVAHLTGQPLPTRRRQTLRVVLDILIIAVALVSALTMIALR